MYATIRRIIFLLLALSVAPLSRVAVRAEEAANDADDYYNDDQMQQADDYVEEEQEAAWENYQWQGDDYIQYWTEFAIYPKRCIV